MDLNNMTKEELIEFIKTNLNIVECQHTFKGYVKDIYWEPGKKQYISFQKGHYYIQSETEPYEIGDDNNIGVSKEEYDFKEYDLCFLPRKIQDWTENKELTDIIFGQKNMENLNKFKDIFDKF